MKVAAGLCFSSRNQLSMKSEGSRSGGTKTSNGGNERSVFLSNRARSARHSDPKADRAARRSSRVDSSSSISALDGGVPGSVGGGGAAASGEAAALLSTGASAEEAAAAWLLLLEEEAVPLLVTAEAAVPVAAAPQQDGDSGSVGPATRGVLPPPVLPQIHVGSESGAAVAGVVMTGARGTRAGAVAAAEEADR